MTYDATIERLESLVDRCAADGDRLGYFPAMYLAVTETVRSRAADGRFADPARMEVFVSRFAQRYLDAYDAWSTSGTCPAAWRTAFYATHEWRMTVLQHLLLGINAHINLDLGVTASEISVEAGDALDAVRADFDAVNDVLRELVDGCQAALDQVSPWLDLVDRIGGSTDETIIRFSLVAARRQAWTVATRLRALDGEARGRAITDVDAAADHVAHAVEHPGLVASALLLAVRIRERARPGDVMQLLRAVRP